MAFQQEASAEFIKERQRAVAEINPGSPKLSKEDFRHLLLLLDENGIVVKLSADLVRRGGILPPLPSHLSGFFRRPSKAKKIVRDIFLTKLLQEADNRRGELWLSWGVMKIPAIIITSLLPLAVLAGEAPSGAAVPEVRIELDQEVFPAEKPSRALVKVRVEAPPATTSVTRSPVNLTIVLDRSGSMQGDKVKYARLAAIEALRRLRPEDVFSLVTYDSEIETVIAAQKVRDLDGAEARIREISPRGSTALYGGVNQGASEIRKQIDGSYVHRILLLSDGIANVGPSSPAELERLGRALARENIAVTTIGIGLDYNEDLMTCLARASGGNTYFVEASEDLPRILTAELGDVLSIFARRAVIRIEFDDQIRPLAILGREGEIRGQTVEIPLHQLYSGRERFGIIEVELPPRPAGAIGNIGRAEVRYEEVATGASRASRSAGATIRFSVDEQEVAASANAAVQKQVLEIRAAEARDRAIDFADRGRRDEAARELREVSALYSRAARRTNDPAMDIRAQQVAQEAEQVEEVGIDNAQRKSYRAANHQTVNQQSTR